MKQKLLKAALFLVMTCGSIFGASGAYVPTPSASTSYSSYVYLSWSSSSSAVYGYQIRRGTSSNFSSSSKLAEFVTSTYYYDRSAALGKTYYYWVCPIYYRNYSAGTYSYWYNTSCYDWGKRYVYVPTPTASAGTYSSYVYLSWSSSSAATYGYLIRRGTSSNFSSSSKLAEFVSGTSYYDRSATVGKKYYYWICPIYYRNYSAGTYSYFYNTSCYDYGWRCLGDVPRPVASDGTYSSYVSLSWSSSSAATYGYLIRRGTSSSFSSSAKLAEFVTGTSYTDSNAKPGVKYYYWICPIYYRNYSAGTYSYWYNASVYDLGWKYVYVPSPTASAGTYSSYVYLSWSSSSAATYGYLIRRGTSSNFNSSSKLAEFVTSTYYYDRSATPGVTYYYWICPIYYRNYSAGTYSYWYNASYYDWGYKYY